MVVEISVTVSNSGDRDGAEVVQFCVSYPPEAMEPPRQLRDFTNVTIPAKESREVSKRGTSQSGIQKNDEYSLFVGTSSFRVV